MPLTLLGPSSIPASLYLEQHMPGHKRPFSARRKSSRESSSPNAAAGTSYSQAAAGVSGEKEPGFLARLFGGGNKAADAQPVSSAPAEWSRVVSGQLALRRGSRGEAVQYLQQQLNGKGATLEADGIFGGGTETAVRNFQRSSGLGVDGVVGKGTAGVLGGGSRAAVEQDEAKDARDAGRGGTNTKQEEGPKSSSKGGPQVNVSPGSFARAGLRPQVMSVAIDVFKNAYKAGKTEKMTYTVIDYSMPSTEKRLFVIDMARGKLLFNELVSHGSNSGGNMMTSHSNKNGSNQTSIGLSRTAETYQSSKFGSTALRIDGLENGYNDNMRQRAVVMHRADYATPEAIKANGGARLGRSQGCPALDPRVSGKIIDTIKNGCLIFSYYPDANYMKDSKYVNG